MPGTPSPVTISTRRRRIALQGRGREVAGEFVARRAGCLNWACPDPWGAEVGNRPGLPDHLRIPDNRRHRELSPNAIKLTSKWLRHQAFAPLGPGPRHPHVLLGTPL